LESVAVNIHEHTNSTACFLLQTSSCILRKRDNQLEGVYDHIRDSALPAFRRFIDAGNVRITIIDHKTYLFPSCNNFYSPSSAWMNYHYWSTATSEEKGEFIDEDSDLVLTLQNDAVLCHTLNPDNWRDVAYVGGVWPPLPNTHNNRVPKEGTCLHLPMLWEDWHKNKDVKRKPFPLSDWCRPDSGMAPIGNGGLTLRSRRWLQEVIRYCPHDVYSGLKRSFPNNGCVTGTGPEDLYFATILAGIRAPMPTAFEASLFSAEMIMSEKVLEYYYSNSSAIASEEELERVVLKRWGQDEVHDGLALFRRMRAEGNTIPIGFHKPFLYFSIEDLSTDQMKRECKFLWNTIPVKYRRKNKNRKGFGINEMIKQRTPLL